MISITNVGALVVVLLVLYVGMRYCVSFVRGEISPRIATWVIFEVGACMSLASYLAGIDHSLKKAALNAADCIQVTVILLVLFFWRRERKIEFTRYEGISLLVSGAAAAAWMISRTGWIGFIGFQTVMTLAYLPTIESLWRWKPGASPEPIEKWATNILIAGIGFVVDVTGERDYLAMVYPLRALLLCILVTSLILRWKQKGRTVI